MPSPYPFPSVIDNSMLSSFLACEEKFNKTYIAEWKPMDHSVHLHAGKSFATGLEFTRKAFYVNNMEAEDAIALGLGELIRAYGNFIPPPDSAKSLERMLGAFEFYWQHYPLERGDSEPLLLASGKRAIEFTFAEPLPINHPVTGDPLIYSGAMDAIYNYAGGVYIVDEKTATQLGQSWVRQWDLRAQFTGYAWGCRQHGIRVDGAIIRGISILKTKYDTAQAITYRPEWQIDRWFSRSLVLIERMIENWKAGRSLYNLDESCGSYGGCAFRTVCSSQDELPYLETQFVRRHWDPIKRVEVDL